MSEFLRCRTQIKVLGFSIFLFAIALVLFASISPEEMNKLMTGKEMANVTDANGDVTTQLVDATLMQSTMQKLMAMAVLSFIASVLFILAMLVATGKGCYKVSLFSIIFGTLFGIL